MFESTSFIPGRQGYTTAPLARYLPPFPDGVVTSWLEKHMPPGSFLLDPFGASPRLVLEAARAGCRVLTAINNPIVRFLTEVYATPIQEDELRAALAVLAASRKGQERLEPYILNLYATVCNHCGREVSADAFLWERDDPTPFARVYHCPYCGDSGEYPTTKVDQAKAARFAASGLHKAHLLERVAPINDPDRRNAEEALETYLPRALHAISTLLNKLDGLFLSAHQKQLLAALLLGAFDRTNSLWTYPAARAAARRRPKQLTPSPQFWEFNLWKALEEAIEIWAFPDARAVPLVYYPDKTPDQGCIRLHQGRLKSLVKSLVNHEIHAVVTAIPRPNQAFWTLSALWSGWLWGHEATGPFKSALRRRRYDWSWHTTALHAAFEHLSPELNPGTPVFGLLPEAEPGFVSAVLSAAEMTGFNLEGISLRSEEGQGQITWSVRAGDLEPAKAPQDPQMAYQRAAHDYLAQLGEPTDYLSLHTATLAEATRTARELFHSSEKTPGEVYNQIGSTFENTFSYRGGFLRFGGSEHSLEIGKWWLSAPTGALTSLHSPLADRVENALVSYLSDHSGSSFEEIDTDLCSTFRGLFTPSRDLVAACLESYGVQTNGGWHLRPEDDIHSRQEDLDEIRAHLIELGERLNFKVEPGSPLLWFDENQEAQYRFYIQTSANVGDVFFGNQGTLRKQAQLGTNLVLPGGRANLLTFKQRRDPRLSLALEAGWGVLKFRHVRRLATSTTLTRENLAEQLTLDPLTSTEQQMKML